MVVGYIGSFSATKGLYELADALPKMLEHEPNLKIMLIGNISKTVPRDLGLEIRKLLAPYHSIRFMGYVPHNELPKYLNEMKLLILPSYTKGLPHVILEAMACGTSVAATPVGGIPEALGYGKFGYLLRLNSSINLANDIIDILKDDRLAQLSEMVSNYVRETYTYELAVNMWKNVFIRVLSCQTNWAKA